VLLAQISLFSYTDAMTIQEEKKELRKEVRSILAEYFKTGKADQDSLRACQRIMDMEAFQKADMVLAYLFHGNEASCQEVIFSALNQGKILALPRVYSGTSKMDFFILNPELAFGDQIEEGSFGISEPLSSLEKVPVDGDLTGKKVFVILPGLAFSPDGMRLGKGKGFYDRYISRLKKSGAELTLAAFCFDCQILPHIPHDEFDLPADLIVTPSQCIGPF